ncbi:phage tail tape measure protein [Henriciella aquimarina]|uniref:phage tail tape measure protein n=1 Tax=Henriciella aquimarina TaxID=545261 RepID=UPI0009FBEE4D|nr:phage tail tape measure protein [Henriciella aquimarina]
MAVSADKIIVELEARVAEYERKIAGADRKFDNHMDSMRRSAGLTERKNVAAFNNIGRSADNMGAKLAGAASALALAAGAAAGIRVLATFEQAMSSVAAVSQATGEELDALTAKARELGATTRFSATQAAEGMLFLARAGFDTNEVLGTIEGTLQLAQAGGLDLGRAADIASNVLQGFRLEVSETARVVDVLAKAANSSNTDVNQLGEAMKYVSPVAAGLNVGIEDTAAAVSALSDAGIQAEMAGTGLRRVMIGLEKQSKQGEKVLAKYGLTMEDISISATGSLANSLRKLSEAGIATADAMTLFGLRGGPAFEVLQSSVPKIDNLTAAFNDAEGTAARMSKIMDDNLNGALLATRSRLEELVLALGEAGATDALINALEVMQDLLTGLAENADIVVAAIVGLTTTALLPMAAAMGGKVIAAVTALQAELVALNAIAGTSTTAIKTFTAVAGRLLITLGPLGIALAASAAAYGLMASNGKDAAASISAAGDALRKYDSVNAQITEDIRTLTGLQNDLSDAIENQKPIIEATKRADIAALNERIAKNRELAGVLEAQARAELANAQKNSGRFTSREAQDLFGERAFGERQQAGTTPGGSPMYVRPLKSQEELNRLLREEYEQVTAIQDAGGQLSKQQRDIIDAYAERLGQAQDLRAAEEEVAALREARLGGAPAGESAAIIPTDPEGFAGGGGEIDNTSQISAIEEIAEAHRQMFQAEADQIEHNYQAQIAAINATKAAEADKEKAREQARAIADAELVELQKREDARIAQQQDFADMVMASRDQMLGNLASMLDREYRLKEDQIRAELKDAAELEDALLALKEERLAAEKDLRDQVLQEGRYADDELSRFQAYYDERLVILQDALEQEKITKEEHDQEIAEMNQEKRDLEREAEIANQQMILAATSDFISALGNLARQRFGENSALAKAFFLAEKIAAVGHVILNAEVAKIRALAELGPILGPPAAASIEVAKNLSLATIAAQTVAGFKDGVIDLQGPGTSRSDSIPARLSRGESVITAAGTRLNAGLLEQINRGVDVEGQLARITQPVNVSPSYFSPGGRPINVAGSSITFTGPINQDTMPEVRALLDEYDRKQDRRIERALYRDRLYSTPRRQKRDIFGR